MNTFVRIFVLSAYVSLVLSSSAKEILSPKFLDDLSEEWWGSLGEEDNASTDIRSFEIKFTDKFSQGTTRPGFRIIEAVLRNLMHRLGFEKFFVQGGDFGALIANSMVTLYLEGILGYHINFPLFPAPSALITYVTGSINPLQQSLVVDPALAERMNPILKVALEIIEETGYLHIQATKPDTIGIAMSDSPMDLFAWLMQAVSWASRRSNQLRADGGFHDLYTPETLIDNAMFYWTENKFTTAVRIYAETIDRRTLGIGLEPIHTQVPTCTVHTKDEIIYMTPAMLKLTASWRLLMYCMYSQKSS